MRVCSNQTYYFPLSLLINKTAIFACKVVINNKNESNKLLFLVVAFHTKE